MEIVQYKTKEDLYFVFLNRKLETVQLPSNFLISIEIDSRVEEVSFENIE